MAPITFLQWVVFALLAVISFLNLREILKKKQSYALFFWLIYTSFLAYGISLGILSILHFLAPIHLAYLRLLPHSPKPVLNNFIKNAWVALLFLLLSYALSVYTKGNWGIAQEGFPFFLDSVFYSQIAHLMDYSGIESAFVGQLSTVYGEFAKPTPYHYPELWASKFLAKLFGVSTLLFFDFWLHSLTLSILAFVFFIHSQTRGIMAFIWAFTLAWLAPGLFTYLNIDSVAYWFNQWVGNDTRPFYFPASRVGGIKNAVVAITGVFFVKAILKKDLSLAAFWGAISILFSIAVAPIIALVLSLMWLQEPKFKELVKPIFFLAPVALGCLVLYGLGIDNQLPKHQLPQIPLFLNTQAFELGYLFRSIWLGPSQLTGIFFWALLFLCFYGLWLYYNSKYFQVFALATLALLITQLFPAASLLGPIQILPYLVLAYFFYQFKGPKSLIFSGGLFIALLALAYLPAVFTKVLDIWQLFNFTFSFLLLPAIFFLGDALILKANGSKSKKLVWIVASVLLLVNSAYINKNSGIGTTSTQTPPSVLNRLKATPHLIRSIFFAKPTNKDHLYVDMLGEEVLTYTNNWTTTPGFALDGFANGFDSAFIKKSNISSWTMPLVKYASRHKGLNREQCLSGFVKDNQIDWVYRHHSYSFAEMAFLIPKQTDSLNFSQGNYTVYFLR